MEGWEAESFEKSIPAATAAGGLANKWEGEDEDDDVKDNWEDEEEEEKKDVEKQEPVKSTVVKKSKKHLAERIEEKERIQREEAARRAKEMEAKVALTPEAQAAEKLRRQKLQEESDLRLTLETFGIAESSKPMSLDGGIEGMNPNTKEEFDALTEALSKKIQSCSKSPLFQDFAENLVRSICATLASQDLKRLKNTVENMLIEKTKLEKGDKGKKSKGKGKAKLKMDGENSVNDYSTYGDYDDLDDFM